MKRILPLIAVVFLLCGCRSSLFTDLAVPSGGILYRDDFSDPASGWPVESVLDWSEGYSAHNYVINVDLPQYDVWAVPGQIFDDSTIEADAVRLAGPDENRFGLICRYHPPQDYYFFIISSDGYYAIGKTINGSAALLGQEMMAYHPAIVKGDGPNLLRFDCIGGTLTGYVNGQVVAAVNDADFSQGEAGLIAGTFSSTGVRIGFGNFMVIKP